MSQIQINVEEIKSDGNEEPVLELDEGAPADQSSWHIPRPSLVGRSDRGSENGSWAHLHPTSNFPSRGSTSSQGSTASTHSAASGTLLLTAANLANLAAMHPPTVTQSKPTEDAASVASSTHFTVVNGLGRPTKVYKKSWCAKNQLTVLICTMSFLFMVGLLVGILCMEVRARNKYN